MQQITWDKSRVLRVDVIRADIKKRKSRQPLCFIFYMHLRYLENNLYLKNSDLFKTSNLAYRFFHCDKRQIDLKLQIFFFNTT